MERQLTTLAAATFVMVFPRLSGAEEIGFRLARKHFVIVPVLVNGQGPYEFLLDTGSTTSVVERKLATDLGLKPLQQTAIRTATGTEGVPIARVHQIDVGSQSARTVLVLCSEMDAVRSLDENIRGILGFNVLSRFRYTLDYRRKKLRFEGVGAVEGTRIPFDPSGRSIILSTGHLRLMLDTGATGVFLFHAGGLDIEMNPRSIGSVSTLSGRHVTRSGLLRRLVIGDETFRGVPITLVPQSELEERADGLVPGTLFDSIYVDHEAGFVVLNPREGEKRGSTQP